MQNSNLRIKDTLSILLGVAAIFSTSCATCRADEKITTLAMDSRISQFLPDNARWALSVIELSGGGRQVVAGNGIAEQLVPGSLVKLATAGAFLDFTGKTGETGLKTTIYFDGIIRKDVLSGNIYIKGSGNPFLSKEDLIAAAAKLKDSGVRSIDGHVIADEITFDTKGVHGRPKYAGDARSGALGLDLHTVALYIEPGEAGQPPKVALLPPNDSIRIAQSALTVKGGTSSLKVRQLDDLGYSVAGNIEAGSGLQAFRFPLNEPALYCAEALKAVLREQGIMVFGDVTMGKVSDTAQLLMEVASPPPAELVKKMNFYSINVLADNLLLHLGAARYGLPGTVSKGTTAIRDFLNSLGFTEREIVILDGSGLNEGNRMSVGVLTSYLAAVTTKGWFPAFYSSLPRVGSEGTLRTFGYANEKFRVKSGRLPNAFGIAGYGEDIKGNKLAFAYIVNTPNEEMLNLEQGGAEIIRYLATGFNHEK